MGGLKWNPAKRKNRVYFDLSLSKEETSWEVWEWSEEAGVEV
jgi:hypothetical protein